MRFQSKKPKFFSLMAFLFLTSAAYSQHGAIELETTTNSPKAKSVYGNSTPIAHGFIEGDSIRGDYGLQSVTKISTGVYEIQLDNGFVDPPVVQTTPQIDGVIGRANTVYYKYDVSSQTITITYVQDVFSGDPSPIDRDFSIVVYGAPLNFGSDCPAVTSGTGFAQAPNDLLRFNFTEDDNCVTDIPFAILDPTPIVEVNVGGFVGGGTDTVEVSVDFASPHGFTSSETVDLTSSGTTLDVGTYIGSSTTPYDVQVILTYDGSQFVTAQVSIVAL